MDRHLGGRVLKWKPNKGGERRSKKVKNQLCVVKPNRHWLGPAGYSIKEGLGRGSYARSGQKDGEEGKLKVSQDHHRATLRSHLPSLAKRGAGGRSVQQLGTTSGKEGLPKTRSHPWGGQNPTSVIEIGG